MATAQTTQAKAEPVAPAVAATPAVAAAPVFKKETITLSEDMTVEQLQELLNKLETQKNAKIKVERDPALVAVKAQIAKFSFTAAELGIKVDATSSAAKAETPAKDHGIPIFSFKDPSFNGRPIVIHKNQQAPVKKIALGAGYRYVKNLGPDIKANLMQFVVKKDEVTAFLATPEGEKFVTDWVACIARDGAKL